MEETILDFIADYLWCYWIGGTTLLLMDVELWYAIPLGIALIPAAIMTKQKQIERTIDELTKNKALCLTESDKSSTTMKEEFSILRYTIELTFIEKLNECKWWQFAKRRKVYQWREQQLFNVVQRPQLRHGF